MIEVIQHFRNTWDMNRGGFSVLATHKDGDSFITVSTAYCSNNDFFVRKTAISILRENMESGEYIKVPLAGGFPMCKVTHADIHSFVQNMFYVAHSEYL